MAFPCLATWVDYCVGPDKISSRKTPGLADLDVIGHVLASRDVGQAFVDLVHDVQHHADVGGFVELRENDLVDAHLAEAGDRQLNALLAGGGGEDQMNLIRPGGGEQCL